MSSVKIEIPLTLRDVTLGQYQDYLSDIEKYGEDTDELYRSMVHRFTNVPREDVDQVSAKDTLFIANQIIHLIKNRNDRLVRIWDAGDFEFGFIPDLEESTFGEWCDIDTYLKDVQDHHRVMAVMYRPIKHKKFDKRIGEHRYNVAPYKTTKEFAEAMREIPLDIYFGAMDFFDVLGRELLQAIPSYLEDQIASQEVVQRLRILAASGAGTEAITRLAKETYEDSTK